MDVTQKSSIKDRLLEAVSKLGFLNNADFIRQSGINKGTFYAIIKNGRNPNSKTLALLRVMGINPDWVTDGKHPILLTKATEADYDTMPMLKLKSDAELIELMKDSYFPIRNKAKIEFERRRSNNPPGPERTNTALEEAGEAHLRAAQTPGQEREQLKNELQTALNQVAGTPMHTETQQTPRPVRAERPEPVDLFDLLYRAMDLLSKEELEVLKFMLERKLKIKGN